MSAESGIDRYTQCELRLGNARQVAWIPERFAKVGTRLRVREHGEWRNGFEVTATYQTATNYELTQIYSAHMSFEYQLQGESAE